jgi:NADH dehydrogenase FAD-containing subunit
MCESALGLADRFRRQIMKRSVSVKLVFPSSMERALAGAGLFRDLESEFERKGITLVEDFPIAEVHKNSISSTFGRRIDHDLLLLMPAVVGEDLFAEKSSITDGEGFVQVDEKMQVVGCDRIFAAGDIISLSGPRFGYMALRQGKVAAENILARVRHTEPKAEYKHDIEWIIGERFTDPIFFHYGFWDETLEDFDEDALFGMAKLIRKRYGTVKYSQDSELRSAAGA